MSRSPVISTIPIFALLIVSSVLSAPREELIVQTPTLGERHETRESEVSRNEESLPRLGSVPEEPIPKVNQNGTEKLTTLSLSTMKQDIVQRNNSESKDMLESLVTPQDDDDTTSKKPWEKEENDSNFDAKKSKDLTDTTMLPPMVFPKSHPNMDIRIATEKWKEEMNQTMYITNATDTGTVNKTGKNPLPMSTVTIPPISSSPTEALSSTGMPTEIAPKEVTITTTTTTTRTTTRPTPERVTLISEIYHDNEEEFTTTTTDRPNSSSQGPAEMKLHEKKERLPEPMPSGVAALIAAISFAIFVVVTYIGLLVRRRYLEWRYGNRELLVNDFDAADEGNFEL